MTGHFPAHAFACNRSPTTNGFWSIAALTHQASNRIIQRINPSHEQYHHSHGLTFQRLHCLFSSLPTTLLALVTSIRHRARAHLSHAPTSQSLSRHSIINPDRVDIFGVGSDSEVRGSVFLLSSLPPPQAARGHPRTQRRASTAAMLDSYAERCNDIMFPVTLNFLMMLLQCS